MSTNKIKYILFSILLIVICSITFSVDASVVDGTLLTAHDYVGQNICAEESVQKILVLAGYILMLAKLAVPLILIIMGSIDLFHAVVGKDEKALTKSFKTLAIRVALGVFIFFIPTLIDWAFDTYYEAAGENNNKQCLECVLHPTECY